MIKIDLTLKPQDLQKDLKNAIELSGQKIKSLDKSWDINQGTPVFTKQGTYTARGWTEWTRGFMYGSAILQFDLTNDGEFLEIGRNGTIDHMPNHITHTGVHDHGFNTISTYGNLLRLMQENKIDENLWEKRFYELACKVSGAVQASRWTHLPNNKGYIYSFNGPHSLFADTMRTLRIVAVSHHLGHQLLSEQDEHVNLLHRLICHAESTAQYNVYFGNDRDRYDEPGRVAHESIFNVASGQYRCPNSQQGFSPFTTWTRGAAWILLGFAEQLEFLSQLNKFEFQKLGVDPKVILNLFENTARITADFMIKNSPIDGIPYWDTGAPTLYKLNNYLDKTSDPFNPYEPVDSSAATIMAQGFIRLGHYLETKNDASGKTYTATGLTITKSLLSDPYISNKPDHQGLILHSIYHQPNGWDFAPEIDKAPYGESSMWGDYHARELMVLLSRLIHNQPYPTFFSVK